MAGMKPGQKDTTGDYVVEKDEKRAEAKGEITGPMYFAYTPFVSCIP